MYVAYIHNMRELPTYQPDFEEYIRQGEPGKKERAQIWRTAIGLQQVDGLETSEYLKDVARQHIEGDISLKEVKSLIDTYYETEEVRNRKDADDKYEADKVSERIAELLSQKTFTFSPAQLVAIHRHLFQGIYKFAGKIRDYNITKKEWVLRGKTVYYTRAEEILDVLNHDFDHEKVFDYSAITLDQAISHLTLFCRDIWQIHPFGEGNTRTTAVFMIKYLRVMGFDVANDLFALHSWYFRNALVRANYINAVQGINYDTTFLERFFRNLLLGENTPLLNREMHLDWKASENAAKVQSTIQSATQSANGLPSKCKNCTLEETAVLRLIQQQPRITQKQLAQQIGKSERTIKSLTVRLTQQGILRRENGKRDGFWVIVND